jgi:hypothetical protein
VTISRSRRTPHQILAARIAAARVPAARPDNLRVATWNIRELGKTRRLPESLAIIARILRCFDLVSIVELRDDLTDFQAILRLLGPTWSAVFSDYRSDHHGNRERMQSLRPFASPTSQRPQTSAANEPGPLGLRSRAQHVNRRKPPSKKSQAPQTKPSAAPPPDSSNRLSEKPATCVSHTRANHSSPAPSATRPGAARRRTRAPPHLGYRD